MGKTLIVRFLRAAVCRFGLFLLDVSFSVLSSFSPLSHQNPRPLSKTPKQKNAQIADAVPEQYAKEDTLAFRSWLEARLAELFPKGEEKEEGQENGNKNRRFSSLDAALRSLDGERQRSLLVPLVFLAHAHRWGCTSPPQWVLDEGAKQKGEKNRKWVLPEELARPLDSVRASVGGIQRSGSVSLLFLRNWRLVAEEGEGEEEEESGEEKKKREKKKGKSRKLPLPGEPFLLSDLSQASLRPRFRFCSRRMSNDCSSSSGSGGDDLEAAEASVLHSVVLTEAAASRLPPALLALFDAAEEAESAEAEEARGSTGVSASSSSEAARRRADAAALAAAEAAEEVSSALRAALSVFHDVFRTSKISTRAWSRHIQPFFCALTSRAEGDDGDEEEEEEEHGVGGAQIPW